MPDLFIRNIDSDLLKRFNNRLNKLRPSGAKRGDKRKYVMEAIKQWLDNPECKKAIIGDNIKQ